MTQQIVFDRPGGPEVMRLQTCQLDAPKPGEVRIRHTAIGLNMIDTYHRSGFYPMPLPSGLGMEAAGVIEAMGDGVTGFAVGQRVAYATPPVGAYASARNYVANKLVHIPPKISDETAAAGLVKGLTAWYLLRRCFKVERHHTVLIYAAAGGTGQILARWARHLGANVIGIVGSEEKREIALWAGCEEVFLLDEDYSGTLQQRGGVDVVYDSIGKLSFIRSLDCLKARGLMVSFGNASGAIDALDVKELGDRGSLYLTRPSLMDYVSSHAELEQGWQAFSGLLNDGIIDCEPTQRYALSDVIRAHQELEARKTTGSSVLMP